MSKSLKRKRSPDPEVDDYAPRLLSEEDSRPLKSRHKDGMYSARNSRALSSTGPGSSPSVYRRENLGAVNIHLHAEPPKSVELAIQAIVNATFPEKHLAELAAMAKSFHNHCLECVRAQEGEYDLIKPLCTAIKALGLKDICIRENDMWQSELRPVASQPQRFSSSFMTGIQKLRLDVGSSPATKRQRQHANERIPPSLPKTGDRSPVKTPHPKLSIGIRTQAFVSALARHLDEDESLAREFFNWVQLERVQREPGTPLQPMLSSVPAAPFNSDLVFPFAVVEGEQIYDAENRAAVSMACAHNILHCLDRMAVRTADLGRTGSARPHVLFSITAQGPIHELWAHWTAERAGVRRFESKLWDSWNVLAQNQAVDFIAKLHSVCAWGTGPFMHSVVEGLAKVAVQART